jgi:hypothetical protein
VRAVAHKEQRRWSYWELAHALRHRIFGRTHVARKMPRGSTKAQRRARGRAATVTQAPAPSAQPEEEGDIDIAAVMQESNVAFAQYLQAYTAASVQLLRRWPTFVPDVALAATR